MSERHRYGTRSLLVDVATSVGVLGWAAAGVLSFLPWVEVGLPDLGEFENAGLPYDLLQALEQGWAPGDSPLTGAISLLATTAGMVGLVRVKTHGGAIGGVSSSCLAAGVLLAALVAWGAASSARRLSNWLLPSAWEPYSPTFDARWPLAAYCATTAAVLTVSVIATLTRPPRTVSKIGRDAQGWLDRLVEAIKPPRRRTPKEPATSGDVDDFLRGGPVIPD